MRSWRYVAGSAYRDLVDETAAPRTEVVDVPGAQLHTEVRGTEPLLLLVVGGNGDPTIFEPLAALLASRWTVRPHRAPRRPDGGARLELRGDRVR
jgi:hypothetical protein